MHVAVLGGGLQGCCIALALADSGVRVTLFDRNGTLLSRTAVANEGKIHLGYMYAKDPSLSTARLMIQGALAFAPFMTRHLGIALEEIRLSTPTVYLVHRESQRTVDQIAGYLSAVHRLAQEAAGATGRGYFGNDLRDGLRQWSATQRETEFDATDVLAAFDTPEVAIEPVALADALRLRIEQTPNIELRLEETVSAVQEDGFRIRVLSEISGGPQQSSFDQVVNALWDGRLAVDSTFNLRPERQWLHRLKYGIGFRLPLDALVGPSVTVVLGPFGEAVNYRDRQMYLTWYPAGMVGLSRELTPPDWPTYPSDEAGRRILEASFAALSGIVLSLRSTHVGQLESVCVKGGVIVAWGQSDIYDPASELHRRYQIGVRSKGNYHSVDPGKLTMAPYFADVCAARILGQ